MPRGAVQRNATDRLCCFAGCAHIARPHSSVKREARTLGGMQRGEGGIEAALLVKARGAAVRGEVKVVGAQRVGGKQARLDRGKR